jgi:hypothetical protein
MYESSIIGSIIINTCTIYKEICQDDKFDNRTPSLLLHWEYIMKIRMAKRSILLVILVFKFYSKQMTFQVSRETVYLVVSIRSTLFVMVEWWKDGNMFIWQTRSGRYTLYTINTPEKFGLFNFKESIFPNIGMTEGSITIC